MTAWRRLFDVEEAQTALVIAPLGDVGPHEMIAIESVLDEMTRRMDQTKRRHVVVDFRHSPHFGSNLLSTLLRLWHRVRARSGKMILCNLQASDLQMLGLTHLDVIWPTTATLQEALDLLATPGR
jgi:anti-anti-sigma factor